MTAKPDLDQPKTKLQPVRTIRVMICTNCDYDAGDSPISTRRCPACHHVNTFEPVVLPAVVKQ